MGNDQLVHEYTTLKELDRLLESRGVVPEFRKVGVSYLVQLNTRRDTPILVECGATIWEAFDKSLGAFDVDTAQKARKELSAAGDRRNADGDR